MGEVYRARDPRLKREVAIKVLPSSYSSDADRLRRFEQEAQAASALNHPNILTIYDIGSEGNAPYIVSELLEGETLRSAFGVGALPVRRAVGYASQIADGLAAAHEKGIVHRDLKPENIFITKDSRIKILDFGLAKLMQAENKDPGESGLPTISGATGSGVVLGTLGYMSPEQLRGQPADLRSDIFSFGAILYEMLSGRRAFRGDTSADTVSAILKEDPPDLSASDRRIPPGLQRIVRHCLEKNPLQRFQSAHDLGFDLETVSDVSGFTATAPQSSMPKTDSRRRAAWTGAGLIAVLIVAAGLMALLRPRRQTIDSLAVLPFVNATADPASEYLSDGVTENLISSLSQIPTLTVMSHNAVSKYKRKVADAQLAGNELKVQAVLTGRVEQRGSDLTVSTELVDVRKNSQIWGGRFTRPSADILAIQENLVQEISDKLRPKLTGEEKNRVVRRPTDNSEAYQLYLKGRYFWAKREEEPIRKSIGYFMAALEKDPGYALAYSGLADAFAVAGGYSFLSPAESVPKARAAAVKAQELDPTLAQPHVILGLCLWSYDWQWAAGENELRKAITLDPRNSPAHQYYGLLLMAVGRPQEALMEFGRAHELDPFSPVIQQNIASAYIYMRQWDKAIEEARRAPEFARSHWIMARAYAEKGMQPEAIAEYEKAADLLPVTPDKLFYSGLRQAAAKDESGAQKTIDELELLAKRRYVPPIYNAYIYALLHRSEETLSWLEKSYSDHSYYLNYLKVTPTWDFVRSEPRFQSLLRRINLAP